MHFDKKLPKKYSVHISGYIPDDDDDDDDVDDDEG